MYNPLCLREKGQKLNLNEKIYAYNKLIKNDMNKNTLFKAFLLVAVHF